MKLTKIGFEPELSAVESDRSVNYAKTIAI